MSNRDSGRITPANIIAMLGLAMIGVVSFFGAMLHSPDGKPAGAIFWAVIVVGLLAGFLALSIYAKKADENISKWRFVEWGSLAIYILLAFLFSGPFLNFFYISSEKADLQKEARTELDAIKKMRDEYHAQRKEAIRTAWEQIQNYKNSGMTTNDALLRDLSGASNDWEEKTLEITALNEDPTIKELEVRVANWNLFDIASMSADMNDLVKKYPKCIEDVILNNKEEHHLIPVIIGNMYEDGSYEIRSYADFDLGYLEKTGDENNPSKFAASISKTEGSNALGWIAYIFCNLLVLLNLLVTRRSGIVGPTDSKKPVPGPAL